MYAYTMNAVVKRLGLWYACIPKSEAFDYYVSGNEHRAGEACEVALASVVSCQWQLTKVSVHSTCTHSL